MEQKLLDFTKEQFRFKYPEVQFYPEELFIQIGTGAFASGSFKVGIGEGKKKENEKIRGYFVCADHRMKIEPLTFSDAEAEIRYSYDTALLAKGHTYSGKIVLISSHGEFVLPYHVKMQEQVLRCKNEEIKDFDDFIALAKKDFSAAGTLFFKEDFEALLTDKKEAALARKGLLFSTDRLHALEEFLCCCGAKEKVKLSADCLSYEYHLMEKAVKYKILLKRNTWGYVRARLLLQTNYLSVSKTEITEKDFVNDVCEVEVLVDPVKIGGKKLKEELRIQSLNEEVLIDIKVIPMEAAKSVFMSEKRNTEYFRQAVSTFYNYRMGNVSKAAMITGIKAAIRLSRKENREETAYIEAYLTYLTGETEETKRLLSENEKWEKKPLSGALHNYLNFLAGNEEEKKTALFKMEDLAKNYGVTEAYLFILHMEERFQESDINKFELLRKLHESGFSGIFLYLEAFLILNKNPLLINKMDSFSERIFIKALRYGFSLNPDTALRYVELATDLREYRPLVLSTLEALYEKNRSETTLNALISQLLKSDKFYEKARAYLKEGVKKGIKLTGIYELYAKSLREDDEIEPATFTYFLYGNSLSSGAKSLLYSYLIRHKNVAGMKEVYEKYQDRITEFALDELKRGEISRPHLMIYKELIKDREFVNRAAESLVKLVYKCFVFVEDRRFSQVLVLHKGLLKPKNYKIEGGEAYVDKLRKSSMLFVSDTSGRIFIPDERVLVEELFRYELYEHKFNKNAAKDILTSLQILEESEKGTSEKFFEACNFLLETNVLDFGYRKKAEKRLLSYYEANGDLMRLEAALDKADFSAYEKEDGKAAALMLIKYRIRRRYLEAVKYYGIHELPTEDLRLLTEEILRYNREDMKPFLLEASQRIIEENSSGDETFRFFMEKLEAPTDTLFQLMERLREKDLLTVTFKRRLIEQALFTECLDERLENILPVLDEEVFSDLKRAFLNYSYYRLLLSDVPPGEYAFGKLREEVLRTKSHLPVLTYLKILAGKAELVTEEKEFASIHLLKFIEEGIILPFFKDFIGKCKVPEEIENLMFAFCHADVEDEISIHYKFIVEGEKETGSMVTEWMKNIYMGIFVKKFLIFADERIKYYISFMEGKEEHILKSDELSVDLEELLMVDGRSSLYAEINNIFLARSLDDKKALYEYMKNYVVQRDAVKEIFRLQPKENDL